MKNSLKATIIFACILASNVHANVKVSRIFGHNMVLQRDMKVPIWGWAAKGEKVTVVFGEQKKSVITPASGKWLVNLDPMPASNKAQKMVISGKNKIIIKNILVGEVWLCSGQSNMYWRTKNVMRGKQECAEANYPDIRLMQVGMGGSKVRDRDIRSGKWKVCSPTTVENFSAVAYFFGRELYRKLRVPVGLIHSSWGGTRIEPWIPACGYALEPEAKKRAKSAPPKRPYLAPKVICNTMIAPLAPYTIKGVIWYQGESNRLEKMAYYYKMRALVGGWRKLWERGDLPFYYVQLANFKQPDLSAVSIDKHGFTTVREAQRRFLDCYKNTGMVVTIDIGYDKDVHPRNKQDVGERLAKWALAKDYGKNIAYSGPLYKSMKIKGNKAIISFNHVNSGLMIGKKDGLRPVKEVKGNKLKWFAISGKDGHWHCANAEIVGNKVVVSSPKVSSPIAVRYAYVMNPEGAKLYNREGLPASPFTTDGLK